MTIQFERAASPGTRIRDVRADQSDVVQLHNALVEGGLKTLADRVQEVVRVRLDAPPSSSQARKAATSGPSLVAE